MSGYAELQATTNFSFLRGASHAHELVIEAARLGHAALAVTDRNSLAGIVRAHLAARALGFTLVVGCRLDFRDGTPSVLCWPTDRAAYGRLVRLITLGKRRAAKGECLLDRADLLAHGEGQIVALVPPSRLDAGFRDAGLALAREFRGRAYLAASRRYRGDDLRRLHRLARLALDLGLPLVATNDVLYHRPERRRLQDVLTCIREGRTIDDAGRLLEPNAERHLKPPDEMARLFARHPDALARTLEIASRCRFGLEELRYEYPDEIAPGGERPQARLARLAREGARRRWPAGVPARFADQIERELALIAKLDYAPFFLTVEDVVRFAREQGILHQGRGSAANSVVCYALGITSVDPEKSDLLFERFISDARDEPPDIDVDFEHERREEVIQYIYRRFGRERAGLAATVICYRTRGAIREVGKALGLSPDVVKALGGSVWGWSEEGVDDASVREAGLDPDDSRLRLALDLARELIGFPRHLSQHPGGFVITRGRLDELAPIENAAMPERTMISWDKDDLESLGMLKVDVLALGMLTCIAKGFALLKAHRGLDFDLAGVPADDPAVYAMLSRADSVGVFQVESRAQQAMLPRLRPRNFYDLVIEVAIVRPGPIQGDMVHPYLRRRQGKEPITYPSAELERVLGKTLGVPLFQEQCMKLAIVGAGFAPARADELRRAMATFRKAGTIHSFRDEFVGGMIARGYASEFAERCFRQIEGFGTYGFPESHAAAFALLVYVSAWIKCHHPDVFCCAILNSQPMGFYAPAQLIRDAREHGVEIRPVDVNRSRWDHFLEPASRGPWLALRLGFRLVAGLREAEITKLVDRRGVGYASPEELQRRAGIGRATLIALAEADSFGSLGLDRRAALWRVSGLAEDPPPLLADAAAPEPPAALPATPPGRDVAEDYAALGLTLKRHPIAFLRPMLDHDGIAAAATLAGRRSGERVTVAGLVLFRQRPGTAKDTIFVTLEDETGSVNLIVWRNVWERCRRAVFGAKLIVCAGALQIEDGVVHVIADRLDDATAWLRHLRDDPQFVLRHGGGDARKHAGAPDQRLRATRPPLPEEFADEAEAMRLRSRDFR